MVSFAARLAPARVRWGAFAPVARAWLGEHLPPLAAIALVIAVACSRVLLTREASFVNWLDNLDQQYPWYVEVSRQIKQGDFALWDTHQHSGHLLAGDPQAGVFYPLNLLFFALAPGHLSIYQLDLLTALHFLLAACGMYLLMRQLVGRWAAAASGVTFALGGFMALRAAAQASIFFNAVWLPWALAALVAGRRDGRFRWPTLGAIPFAFMFLGGHIQPPLHAAVILGGYVGMGALAAWRETGAARRALTPLLQGAVTLGGGALLAAPQLLLSAEYARQAYRWIGLDGPVSGLARVPYAATIQHSLDPREFANFFSPDLVPMTEWNSLYFGVAGFMLMLYALWCRPRDPHVRFFAATLVGFLIYALGQHTPLHRLVYLLVPFADKVREAGRGAYDVGFAGAALAGLGLDALLRRPPPVARAANRARAARWAAAALASALVVAWVRPWTLAIISIEQRVAVAAAWIVLVGVSLVLAHRDRLAGGTAGAIAGGVLLLELVGFALSPWVSRPITWNAPHSVAQEYAVTPVVQFLQQHAEGEAIESAGGVLPPNFGDVFDLRSTAGYGPTMDARYFTFRQITGQPFSVIHDLLGVKYLVISEPVPGLPLAFQDGNVWVYENPHVLPRAWLVPRARTLPSREAVLAALADPAFDPRAVALATTALSLPEAAPGAAASGDVALVGEGARYVVLRTASAAPGVLVYGGAMYPGWQATIDGVAAPVVEVDGGLRGVTVPAGAHTVALVFRPASFRLGPALTLSAALLLVGIGLADLRRGRGRESHRKGGSEAG